MAAYKLLPFAQGSVNLITLESIIRSQNINKLINTTKNIILTTVHQHSHILY